MPVYFVFSLSDFFCKEDMHLIGFLSIASAVPSDAQAKGVLAAQ